MSTAEQCAHDTCRCTKPYDARNQALGTAFVDRNATYCSRRCEEQANGAFGDDACECEHVRCLAPASEGTPPMQ
ncbi:MAG: hypothetical protein JOZ24_04145 [Candidatus Eremiobacteraeota bacterium]|nr:hypothetical protein [Candidatus Eremiobacteraeota bacterium]